MKHTVRVFGVLVLFAANLSADERVDGAAPQVAKVGPKSKPEPTKPEPTQPALPKPEPKPQSIPVADVKPIGPIDYVAQVKPILASKCFGCHGALKQQSGLRLDVALLIRKGGESGPVIVAGKASESLLIEKVAATDADERMPPEGEGEPLTAEQIAVLEHWIDQGAVAPEEPIPPDPRNHWAYRPPTPPEVPKPANADWVRNDVDAFLAARHEDAGLTPAPPAAKEVLLRRLHLDLVGLPPTREELHAFSNDDSPRAYEGLVDRLLESPQYGERWGRHWMDVWRYSDWTGYNGKRYGERHVWRWRDWIIESLNVDKGYDRMLLEMLAADELVPGDDSAVRATGFLARSWYKFDRNVWLDDVIEHTCKAFLGMTFNCARCHDHKYDPIRQQEYYRLRAIFEPYDVRTDRISAQMNPAIDGLARVYDKQLRAATYLFERGDPKRPDKEHPLQPGVPAVIAGEFEVRPVSLPFEGWHPAMRGVVVRDMIASATASVEASEKELAGPNEKLAEKKVATAKAKLAALKARFDAERAKHGVLTPLPDRPAGTEAGPVRPDFEALTTATKDANTKRTAATAAKKAHDGLITTKQKPAQTKATAAASALTKAQTDKTGADKALTTANAEVAKAKTALDTAEAAAKVAEALSKKIAGDANKKKEEKDKAAKDAATKRTAATTAKKAHDGLITTKQKPAQTKATTAASTLTKALTDKTAADKALTTANAEVAKAKTTYENTEKVAKAAEIIAATAKANATKVVTALTKAAVTAERLVRLAAADENLVAVTQELDRARSAAAKSDDAKAKQAVEAAKKKVDAARKALDTTWKATENLTAYQRIGPTYPKTSTGRRLALARWIVDPRNPLTARVAVNHIWLRHFGRPLVKSVDDFGLRSPRPRLVGLLDYLAVELMEHDWSMKHVHRLIVTSSAYRMSSSTGRAAGASREKDPDNELFWRMNARRMEAEAVRDAVLHVAGSLDLTRGGPDLDHKKGMTVPRRSLYFRHARERQMQFLLMFDAANPRECYRRQESIRPQQAYALVNSSLTLGQSRKLAARLVGEGEISSEREGKSTIDEAAFIVAAFETVLSRQPKDAELMECRKFLVLQAEQLADTAKLELLGSDADPVPPPADPAQRARKNLVLVLFNHNDFVTVR